MGKHPRGAVAPFKLAPHRPTGQRGGLCVPYRRFARHMRFVRYLPLCSWPGPGTYSTSPFLGSGRLWSPLVAPGRPWSPLVASGRLKSQVMKEAFLEDKIYIGYNQYMSNQIPV